MLITVIISGVALGVVAGIMAGLLGIGGGLVIVPVLVYLLPLLKVSPELVMPMALGTSLATIVFTSASATIAHHKNQNIPWSIARNLMITIALGALTGAYLADSLSPETLRKIFSVAVVILAFRMLYVSKKSAFRSLPHKGFMHLISYLTGTLASLMGIAGGAILIPVLNYFGVPIRHAIGIATACGAVVASFGAVGFIFTGIDQVNLPQWSLGYIYLPLLLSIIIPSSLFAPVGVKLAKKMPVESLKKAFAVMLILVAIKMMTH